MWLDVGNLLTSLTILITLAALLHAVTKDRRSRERDFADRVNRGSTEPKPGRSIVAMWRVGAS